MLRKFAQAARLRLRAADAESAVCVAESVRAAIEALVIHDLKDSTLSVTVSAGVACAAGGAVITPDMLYHRADTALYAAKDGGRNRIELAADL